MNLKIRLIGLNTLLVLSLLLAACGVQPTPPSPTLDTNLLFTQAAMTVVADLTKNAPTLTPTLAATNTPLPTLTPLGGMLPTLPPLATLPPLSTATTQGYSGADKAEYITQSPSDYATVKTGQTFNITWRLQNIGTTTWNQNYVYRFYSASNKLPTSANGYNLPSTVAPKAFVDLTVVAVAPSTPGTYDTRWVLTNATGENFRAFDLTVNVIQGSSGSSTVATATGAPDACSDKNYVWGGDARGVDQAGGPVTVDVQGGQVYMVWTADTTAGVTGTFGVTYDAVGVDNMDTISVTTSGSKWFGEPDQNSHPVTITVTGTGKITITMLSINGNSKCY